MGPGIGEVISQNSGVLAAWEAVPGENTAYHFCQMINGNRGELRKHTYLFIKGHSKVSLEGKQNWEEDRSGEGI